MRRQGLEGVAMLLSRIRSAAQRGTMKVQNPRLIEALEQTMGLPAADDQIAVDLARWQAGADGWWGDPEEPTAALVARMQELDDRKAEILPFLRPRLLQPGAVSGQSGRSGYLARLSESLYHAEQRFPVGLGPVEAIGTRLLGRVISSEVACADAKTLGRHGDLIAPYAQALAMYLVEQADWVSPPSVERSS